MVCFKCLKKKPLKIALPDIPTPTSYQLTKKFYPGVKEIVSAISNLTNIKISFVSTSKNQHHDVPGEWFKGPF